MWYVVGERGDSLQRDRRKGGVKKNIRSSGRQAGRRRVGEGEKEKQAKNQINQFRIQRIKQVHVDRPTTRAHNHHMGMGMGFVLWFWIKTSRTTKQTHIILLSLFLLYPLVFWGPVYFCSCTNYFLFLYLSWEMRLWVSRRFPVALAYVVDTWHFTPSVVILTLQFHFFFFKPLFSHLLYFKSFYSNTQIKKILDRILSISFLIRKSPFNSIYVKRKTSTHMLHCY